MNLNENLLLTSRINTSSILEKSADLLLMPARILLGGRKVIVLPNRSMHIIPQNIERISLNPWVQVALSVIGLVLLPFSIIGAFVKLICLKDRSYRDFCAQKIPEESINC